LSKRHFKIAFLSQQSVGTNRPFGEGISHFVEFFIKKIPIMTTFAVGNRIQTEGAKRSIMN
jgi:hypothetical protein